MVFADDFALYWCPKNLGFRWKPYCGERWHVQNASPQETEGSPREIVYVCAPHLFILDRAFSYLAGSDYSRKFLGCKKNDAVR